MCGSTERPESLDTQEFRFRRGDRVRATRDNNSVQAGWVGTYDDTPGDGIPYVDWDGHGVLISAEDALEPEPVAEAAEPEETETPAVPKVGDTVELVEDYYYGGLKKGDRGVVVRGAYGYAPALHPLVGVDYGRPGFENTGTYASRLRVVPAQPEPLAAALAHIPPRHVLGTWDATEPEASREATVEVFGEPTTEDVEVARWYDLREGDTIVSRKGQVGPLVVRREVLDVPEPAKPAPGTFGTAVVDGERQHGVIDEDGDFAYQTWDADEGEYGGDEFATGRNFSDFRAYSDAPALPDAETLGNVLRDTSAARADLDTWTEDGELILAELARRARG